MLRTSSTRSQRAQQILLDGIVKNDMPFQYKIIITRLANIIVQRCKKLLVISISFPLPLYHFSILTDNYSEKYESKFYCICSLHSTLILEKLKKKKKNTNWEDKIITLLINDIIKKHISDTEIVTLGWGESYKDQKNNIEVCLEPVQRIKRIIDNYASPKLLSYLRIFTNSKTFSCFFSKIWREKI